MRWCLVLLLAGCDSSWKDFATERAGLLCRHAAACSDSDLGLDCGAYLAQYEPRPDPCALYDAEFGPSCLDQMDALVRASERDPDDCPGAIEVAAPACGKAWVELTYGACRTD